MPKKILILSASPKKNGNTSLLVRSFIDGARAHGAKTEVIETAFLKFKTSGCTSCRICQRIKKYECVINDDAKSILAKMTKADIIVMATPLYFFSASAQLKVIVDRMFSLYKWNNATGAMKTVLKGKTLVLIASAFENIGLNALEKPFALTAAYSGMKFSHLLIPNAGVSGDLKNKKEVLAQAKSLGKKLAR